MTLTVRASRQILRRHNSVSTARLRLAAASLSSWGHPGQGRKAARQYSMWRLSMHNEYYRLMNTWVALVNTHRCTNNLPSCVKTSDLGSSHLQHSV